MLARTHNDRQKKNIKLAPCTLDHWIIMDALILSAGEGTRLRPLTYTKPKPLLPILNLTLLEWTLEYLRRFSIDRVILNTHHLADRIEDYVQTQKAYRSFEIETRFEPQILNTGGGLVNVRDFFRSDPFMMISGDILTDIDLKKAVDFHRNHNDPVTLVLHDYPEFNQIKVDSDGRILKLRKGDVQGLDFANIHILDQAVFSFLPSTGNFDIIPAYQQMIDEGITIRAYVSQGHHWWNIGTPKTYLKVHEELLTTPSLTLLSPLFFSSPPLSKGGLGGILIHPEAFIEPGVKFSGWACIGKGCLLKNGCHLQNSVIWEDVIVESGVSVIDSIVGQRVHLEHNLQTEVTI
jgi:NDP-sugar pyrophosphorylase family protein